MKVSKTSIYAIRLIVRLAKEENKNLLMVEELAKEEKIPKHYAAKILQRLAKYDYVDSFKGRGGGFRLTNKSWNLSLYEVIEFLDGKIKLEYCFFEFSSCSVADPCTFCKEWNIISNQIIDLLINYKIGDLAKYRSPNAIFNKMNNLKAYV